MVQNFEDDYEDELYEPPKRWRRVLFVLISLLLIFAILATTIIPALIAADRNEILRRLPTPTVLPRT